MSAIEWTISLRTNFTDRDKDEAAKHNVLVAARKLQVLMKFLQDDIEPEICVANEDFYAGKKEISLYADLVDEELSPDAPQADREAGDEVSSELMQALMDMKKED